jgi:predicted RNA-binding Zn-ribbon protein involved in translation (DUF1610 family)
MYSILKPNYVYRDTSEDIADHDDDYDAEEWNYNGRDVYRGSLDRSFDWNVYSLYDENSKRVGIAEHHPEHPEIFFTLWFRDNVFSTLFQEKWECKDATIWSILSNEAYQDCLEDDFKTVFDKTLNTNIRLMTPDMIINTPEIHACPKCGKKSLLSLNGCSEIKRPYIDSNCSVLFVDESFIMYTAPADSRVWSKVHLPPGGDEADDQLVQKQESAQLPLQPEIQHHTPTPHSEPDSHQAEQPDSPPLQS